MSVIVKDKIAEYLELALGKPVDLTPVPDDTPLNTFGLDSLSTISVLVTILEDCGVDLGEHADSLVTPSTLEDLYAIAGRFMGDQDSTSKGSEMPGELRSQLDFYQEKLAYEIDSADLKAALEEGQELVVVDGRGSGAYAAEHIAGAISIPHRSISQDSVAGLSTAPLYVAYCDGIGCNASTKTAIKLATAGFRVKELIGGLDWWKREGYPTEGQTAYCEVHEHAACGCAG
jgi:rhodanese-related sulfurtransferase/acyl carrier protein